MAPDEPLPGTDDEPVPDPGGPRDRRGDSAGEWAMDTALGAASTVGRMASAFGRSIPGRAAGTAARYVTRPLTDEGHEVRSQAVPAAKEVLTQVTPGVVDAVGINEVLAAIDVDALLDRIDVNRLVGRIDLDGIVQGIDIDSIVQGIDIDGIIQKVDLNAVLDKLDLDALLDKLDLDALLDKLDLDALLDKLDLDQVLARIDIDALVSQTELGAIITRSTSGIASTVLDGVRSQGVTLDNLVVRVVARFMRRDPGALPEGPPLLVAPEPRALPVGTEEEP